MSRVGSDSSFNIPVPTHVAAAMEDRRGRVEGSIDNDGNYHDTYKGEAVIGEKNAETQSFEYRWQV